MKNIQNLLTCLLRQCYGNVDKIPKKCREITGVITEIFRQSEDDRKILERALRFSSDELIQANSEMEAMFDALPDWLLRLDKNGKIIDFKVGNLKDLFLKPDDFIGKKIYELPFDDDLKSKFKNLIKKIHKEKTFDAIEYSLKIKNIINYYEARCTPLVNNDQIIVIIRNITQNKIVDDKVKKYQSELEIKVKERTKALRNINQTLQEEITERKKIQKELIESEKKFIDIFHASDDAILFLDKDRFIDCNKATIKMLGYQNREEVLAKHPWELSPKKQPNGKLSKNQTKEMIKIALKKGFKRFEWVHKKASGEDFNVEVALTTILLQGKPIIYVVWRDITDYKKASKALCESEEKYRSLVENMPIGIYRADPGQNGKLLMVNPALVKMFGYKSKKEGINLKVADFYADPKQRKKFSDMLLSKGSVMGIEEKLLKKDGTPIWISITSRLVKDPDGKIYFDGAIEDITERREVQETLKKSYEKLKALDKMKDEFLIIASHELRTPMTVARGYASMILEDHAHEISDEVKHQVENILNSTERLISMVNDMLDIAKIEAGKLSDLKLEKIKIGKFIYQIESSYLPIARAKKIKIKIDLPDIKLPQILFSEEKLKQVFNNIIGNAIKYTQNGGSIKISARKMNRQDRVCVCIEDNGPGIPKKYHKIIFEKFGTVESPLTRKEDGTGLGLAISKEIIEHYNGQIWLESDKAKGAKFSFTLPVAK